MSMKLNDFPQEMIDDYKLNDVVYNSGLVYMEIRKALYGLYQSSPFTARKLAADLKPYVYYNVTKTNGLWRH